MFYVSDQAKLALSRSTSKEHTPGMNTLQNGTYRHYKGPLYDVLGLARHSETEEWLVVYRPQYGERGLWVRPLSMFTEMVEYQGRQLPRFEYLGTAAAEQSIDRTQALS